METVPIKNTAMPAAPVAKAPVEFEFHFAGSGFYEPLTVKAATRAEAEAKWKEKRTPYTQPAQPAVQEAPAA